MTELDRLIGVLRNMPELELAVLIGSRATGADAPQSDWDLAIRWERHIDGLACLERTEFLRHQIAEATGIHPDQLDLIDIPAARLAMRAVIAEEGVVLKGEETLAWSHYLTGTWGELEDYYWRQNHAA